MIIILLSLRRNTSADERTENDVFPSVTAHRLQNAKNVTRGTINANSLRNRMGAVHELITNNIDTCLLQRLTLMKIFQNQQFDISNYKTYHRGRNKHGGKYYVKTIKTFHASS